MWPNKLRFDDVILRESNIGEVLGNGKGNICQVKIDMVISGSACRAEGRRPEARRVEPENTISIVIQTVCHLEAL